MDVDARKFLNGLDGVEKNIVAAVKRGVMLAAEQTLGDAQEMTPVATGTLAASANRKEVVVSKREVSCEIGFNTNYAVYVHEDLTVHHESPGRAKFLEIAMRENAERGTVNKAVGLEIRKVAK